MISTTMKMTSLAASLIEERMESRADKQATEHFLHCSVTMTISSREDSPLLLSHQTALGEGQGARPNQSALQLRQCIYRFNIETARQSRPKGQRSLSRTELRKSQRKR
jgi:hypothetical protein